MDLHTLHVSSALTNVTCGVVLAVAWSVRSEKSFLGWWSIAFMTFAFGLLLQIAGEANRIVGALTYALLVAGCLCMQAGFRSFDGRRGFSRLMLASLPLAPATYLSLYLVAPGTVVPELATFIVSCVIAWQVPVYVLRHNKDRLAFRWVAGAAFAVQSAVTLVVGLVGSESLTANNVALIISLSDQICTTIVVACVLGMVIERDNRRLDRMVHRDALTGCLNRAGLSAYGESAGGTHGVLVADLDHFKQLNDRFGHAAGDEALRVFVRRIERHLPHGAIMARTGGEEFVVLLPRSNAEEAGPIAHILRDAIDTQLLDFEGKSIAFTVSIGVAEIGEGETVWTGIRRADTALYMAKKAGRNRVAFYDQPIGETSPALTAPSMAGAA